MLTTGQRIRKLRKGKRLTQEKLAELVDVDHRTVVRWEKHDWIPHGENLLRLSKILGVSPEYILKEENYDVRSEIKEAEN